MSEKLGRLPSVAFWIVTTLLVAVLVICLLGSIIGLMVQPQFPRLIMYGAVGGQSGTEGKRDGKRAYWVQAAADHVNRRSGLALLLFSNFFSSFLASSACTEPRCHKTRLGRYRAHRFRNLNYESYKQPRRLRPTH